MHIREAVYEDLHGLLALYTQLHHNTIPEENESLTGLWHAMIEDPNYHILAAEEAGVIVSSCTLVVVPNLTHEQRPYALIENVITDQNHRGQGLATAVLEHAKALAKQSRCYKIMLMTGSKEPSTLSFYERAGYNRNDKTAFIQWLED